jgi:hypothetical protein
VLVGQLLYYVQYLPEILNPCPRITGGSVIWILLQSRALNLNSGPKQRPQSRPPDLHLRKTLTLRFLQKKNEDLAMIV